MAYSILLTGFVTFTESHAFINGLIQGMERARTWSVGLAVCCSRILLQYHYYSRFRIAVVMDWL